MGAPNVLILDEPTNDLDIQTLTILEDYLDRFDGIIIIVSHDRYFLDRMASRIFSFEGNGRIRQYEGGYSDYLIKKELECPQEMEAAKAVGSSSGRMAEGGELVQEEKPSWKQHEKKLKFSYKEQREFEVIDDEIAELEEKISALEAGIAANASNYGKLNQLMQEKEARVEELEEKMDRWVYLNDLNDKIQAEKENQG